MAKLTVTVEVSWRADGGDCDFDQEELRDQISWGVQEAVMDVIGPGSTEGRVVDIKVEP